ncbi:MAG: MerR family transcriptional regulator [Acidobacteriaceae bacterium]|nr:MerR family transcriptional regulator [Acidobacteriaceae bacterium]
MILKQFALGSVEEILDEIDEQYLPCERIDAAELSKMIGVPLRTIREWEKEGELFWPLSESEESPSEW